MNYFNLILQRHVIYANQELNFIFILYLVLPYRQLFF